MARVSSEVRASLARHVRSRIGLVFEGTRAFAFDTAIERVCAAFECRPEELLERLDAGHPIWASFVEALTVGESYFFRDAVHFEPFAAHLRAHGGARVWSVGCAAGEEPYSLAIIALETLGDAACDRVKIWASDVNPEFLARATAGRYRDWATRGVAPHLIATYFRRDGAELVLDPRVRRMVTFSAANLSAPTAAWPGELDFLYCRNVLIYFSVEDTPGVMRELAARLAPGGRLVLGPTDPYPQDPALSRSRDHGFTSWIARASGEVSAPPREPERTRAPGSRAIGRRPPLARAKPRTAARRVSAPTAREPGDALPPCDRARRLADRGNVDEATSVATQAIARDPFDPAPYLVRAVVEQHRGRHVAALRDARRALMLDASIGWAHVVRAASEVALGRHAAALRSLRHARRLLGDLAEQALVPQSGAMHRAEVLSICASLEAAARRGSA